MCGVAGYVQPGGFETGEAQAVSRAMSAAIEHRGPDDAGVWLDSEVGLALAHRRLAVVELSRAGHQPMESRSGRYVISFNGEIYNHKEIRRGVDSRGGGGWRGHSDTEALLGAIDCVGVRRAIEIAVGMFAFALWDRADKVLYLVRDRLGEKPMYFGWQHGVFMFASELKALVAHPSFSNEVDRQALALFVRHGYVPSPWSIYRGIRKLKPGAYVRLCMGGGSVRSGEDPEPESYWTLGDVIIDGRERPFQGDAKESVEALEETLTEAVAHQLEADVPLGAFLSGGVDSSTIVALMQAQSSRPVKTFTVGFQEEGYDEADHARTVAERLGTDHTEIYASARDALDVIPRLPALYDEPFSDSSQIPTSMVSELTRKHVTVALSGDGGDELFGGYGRYIRARELWTALSATPDPLKRWYKRVMSTVPRHWGHEAGLLGKARKLSEILSLQTSEQLYHRLLSHWKEPVRIVRNALEPPTVLADGSSWPDAGEPESRMMAIDTLTYLPDDIMVKVDRASMNVSLETRAPFLDHRVVEFAWRLPLEVKIRDGQSKWVLRQVLDRHVSKELVERPKKGFGVPLADWLRGPLRDWSESLLDEQRLRNEGFLSPDPIRRRWAEHLSGRKNWASCIWDILMFQAWLDARR